jgi:hypothetical protein
VTNTSRSAFMFQNLVVELNQRNGKRTKAILESAKFVSRVDTPTCEASHELVVVPKDPSR